VGLVDRIRGLFGGKRSTGADSTALIGGAAIAATSHDDSREESTDAYADPADVGGSSGGGWGDGGAGGGDGGAGGAA
jgi:hypothetical protein